MKIKDSTVCTDNALRFFTVQGQREEACEEFNRKWIGILPTNSLKNVLLCRKECSRTNNINVTNRYRPPTLQGVPKKEPLEIDHIVVI